MSQSVVNNRKRQQQNRFENLADLDPDVPDDSISPAKKKQKKDVSSSRGKNFTDNDRMVFIDILLALNESEKNLFLNKSPSGPDKQRKDKLIKAICSEYNRSTTITTGKRKEDQLVNVWKTMRTTLKKLKSTINRENNRTGGGPSSSVSLSDLYLKMDNLLGGLDEPLINENDSDGSLQVIANDPNRFSQFGNHHTTTQLQNTTSETANTSATGGQEKEVTDEQENETAIREQEDEIGICEQNSIVSDNVELFIDDCEEANDDQTENINEQPTIITPVIDLSSTIDSSQTSISQTITSSRSFLDESLSMQRQSRREDRHNTFIENNFKQKELIKDRISAVKLDSELKQIEIDAHEVITKATLKKMNLENEILKAKLEYYKIKTRNKEASFKQSETVIRQFEKSIEASESIIQANEAKCAYYRLKDSELRRSRFKN